MGVVIALSAGAATFYVAFGWFVALPIISDVENQPYWGHAPAHDKLVMTNAIYEILIIPPVMMAAILLIMFLRFMKTDVNLN